MSTNGSRKFRLISSRYTVEKLVGIHRPVVRLSDIMEDLPEPQRSKYKVQLEKYKRQRETGQGDQEDGQDFGLGVNIPRKVGTALTPAPSFDGDPPSVPDFAVSDSYLEMEQSDQVATSSMHLAGKCNTRHAEYFQKALDLTPRSHSAIIFRPWLDGAEREHEISTKIEARGSPKASMVQLAANSPHLAPINQTQDPAAVISGVEVIENIDYGAIINEFIDSWDVPDHVLADLERDLVHGMPGPLAVFDLTPEDFLPDAERTSGRIEEPMEVDTVQIDTDTPTVPLMEVAAVQIDTETPTVPLAPQEKSAEIEREESFALAEEFMQNEVTKSMRAEPDHRKTYEDFNPPPPQVLSKDPQEFIKIIENLDPFLQNSSKNRVPLRTLSDLNQNGGNQTNQLQLSELISNEPDGPARTSTSFVCSPCPSSSSVSSPGPSPSSVSSPGHSQVTTITMEVVVKAPEDDQLQYNIKRSLKEAKKNAGDDTERMLKIDAELRKLKRLKASREGPPNDLPPLKLSRI